MAYLIYGGMIITTLLFACGTAPHYEAKDLTPIVGRWQGFADHRTYGAFYMRLAVDENGDWQMSSDIPFPQGYVFIGKLWVTEDGRFQASSQQVPELSGTYTLYRDEKGRWLIFKGDDGRVTAQLRK